MQMQLPTGGVSWFAHEEAEMRSSWLERHFVPLNETTGDYEVRRIQATTRAADITAEVARYSSSPAISGTAETECRFEYLVSTADGLMRGRIDAVVPSPKGPVIRDYKSGVLFERGAARRTVKYEYALQLRLYAALYSMARGLWPAGLEILALTGPPQPVKFDKQECLDLLKRAIDDLRSLNHTISRYGAAQEDLELNLSRPSASNCEYCHYRPNCRGYKNSAPLGQHGCMAGQMMLWAPWRKPDNWGTQSA